MSKIIGSLGNQSQYGGLKVARWWAFHLSVVLGCGAALNPASLRAEEDLSIYKNSDRPVDERVKDLVGRMTVEEKARQLDMYDGCWGLLDEAQRSDRTHAKPDATFDSEKAEKALSHLGVGSIHDLYPRAPFYNKVQKWVIQSNRLGIPAMFIEEGLHGYIGLDETVFPQSVNLAATWNLDLARKTGAAIAAEGRAW